MKYLNLFNNINARSVKKSMRINCIVFAVLMFIVFCLLATSCGNKEPETFKVLVFSKTAGFYHGIIPTGIAAIQELGRQNNFEVDSTANAELFTDDNLRQYKVVIFLNTTGDALDDAQQAAFERYIQAGNGYYGIHAASDTEYDWEWYGGLIAGAYFLSHPKIQKAVIKVEDRNHISTKMLPEQWECYDEWYNFRENPREKVTVLASVDESSYSPGKGAMGDHPIIWCHEYDGGRAIYTGLGHTEETFSDPLYLEHLLCAIKWAAGVSE